MTLTEEFPAEQKEMFGNKTLYEIRPPQNLSAVYCVTWLLVSDPKLIISPPRIIPQEPKVI